jgi:hypothetical protein
MAIHNVQRLCETTKTKLKEAIDILEPFLNETPISELNQENSPEMQEFYKGFLSDMRALIVHSEAYYEKLGVALRRQTFNVDYAERVLYDVYHGTVNAFFYPKNECYSEEGRYAYTGQDAIRFRKKPVRIVRDITLSLSKIFEVLREELAYYETDYVTQRRMQGEKA